MIEALIVAGAILIASAALIYFRPRTDDIRAMARTLVRATEKRGEWDETINSEHIKRARVALVLQDKWPELDNEWVSIIIEEAVFDMEADRERQVGSRVHAYDRLGIGRDEPESGSFGIDNERDDGDVADRTASDAISATGWPQFDTGDEDLEIPSSE